MLLLQIKKVESQKVNDWQRKYIFCTCGKKASFTVIVLGIRIFSTTPITKFNLKINNHHSFYRFSWFNHEEQAMATLQCSVEFTFDRLTEKSWCDYVPMCVKEYSSPYLEDNQRMIPSCIPLNINQQQYKEKRLGVSQFKTFDDYQFSC